MSATMSTRIAAGVTAEYLRDLARGSTATTAPNRGSAERRSHANTIRADDGPRRRPLSVRPHARDRRPKRVSTFPTPA